jgi:predicted nucleotidyltransferase
MDKMKTNKIILIVGLFFMLIALFSTVPSRREKRFFTLMPEVVSKYEKELTFRNECVWSNIEKATKLFVHYKISRNKEKMIYWDKYIKRCNMERFNSFHIPSTKQTTTSPKR